MNEEKYLALLAQICVDPDSFGLPPLAPVVAMWLKDFRPGNPEEEHEFDHSSQSIAEELSEIAAITTNEVALVMVAAGYLIRRYPYGTFWSMVYAGPDVATDDE